MLAPFQSARIKLARANEHIQDLKSKVAAFLSHDNVRVVLEMADEYSAAGCGPTAAFVYRQREPVDDAWSAIVGDAIHNLRTALDLTVTDLHRITGGDAKDTAYVHYPFCKDRDSLSDMIRSRRLGRVGKDFVDLIKETAPYKGGNEGLRAIHDLDVLDKHQALVTTLSIVTMDWPVPVTDGSRFVTHGAKDGQRLVILPRAFCEKLPLGTKINANVSVLFGDVGFFAGRDVVRQLESCSTGVDGIVTRFAMLADQKALLSPSGPNP